MRNFSIFLTVRIKDDAKLFLHFYLIASLLEFQSLVVSNNYLLVNYCIYSYEVGTIQEESWISYKNYSLQKTKELVKKFSLVLSPEWFQKSISISFTEISVFDGVRVSINSFSDQISVLLEKEISISLAIKWNFE